MLSLVNFAIIESESKLENDYLAKFRQPAFNNAFLWNAYRSQTFFKDFKPKYSRCSQFNSGFTITCTIWSKKSRQISFWMREETEIFREINLHFIFFLRELRENMKFSAIMHHTFFSSKQFQQSISKHSFVVEKYCKTQSRSKKFVKLTF